MTKKSSILTTKRLAWSAVAACVGCCAIPVIALAFGFTAIAGLGVYLEQAALGFSIAALILFLYLAFRKRQPSCHTNCSCKGTAAKKI
ncbi:hypothetical protein [Marinobacter zhanjiangensis]|uniref:hypothetical protein n=1 Tax=Marinobacter zhanjiangensis TaxID=578215 RepID=UPI0016780842|nr:hypothetical protein [Marinobacter zhanjiangensis]